VAARQTLQTALREGVSGDVSVELIDVFEDPRQAASDGVLVTPTLLRIEPEPRLAIVGNLGDGQRLRRWLDLTPMDSTV